MSKALTMQLCSMTFVVVANYTSCYQSPSWWLMLKKYVFHALHGFLVASQSQKNICYCVTYDIVHIWGASNGPAMSIWLESITNLDQVASLFGSDDTNGVCPWMLGGCMQIPRAQPSHILHVSHTFHLQLTLSRIVACFPRNPLSGQLCPQTYCCCCIEFTRYFPATLHD